MSEKFIRAEELAEIMEISVPYELFDKIQQTSPSVLTTAKSSVIADRERKQLQQIQQNANKQQKKKYFGLE